MRGRVTVRPVSDVFRAGEATALSRHTRASANASMSTTSPSMLCRCVAKESAVEQSTCGSCVKTGGNSITDGVSSNGVTPGAKPRPLTSMSRCENRLHATSECAATLRLPAVPRFTTNGIGSPVQRISARRRASVDAAFTLPTPVYSTCAPARSSWPRDSCGNAMTINGFRSCGAVEKGSAAQLFSRTLVGSPGAGVVQW